MGQRILAPAVLRLSITGMMSRRETALLSTSERQLGLSVMFLLLSRSCTICTKRAKTLGSVVGALAQLLSALGIQKLKYPRARELAFLPFTLVRCANVHGPHAGHLSAGYFVAHPNPLLEGPCFGVHHYTAVVDEYRLSSSIRMNEAVATLTVEPTPYEPRSLAQ